MDLEERIELFRRVGEEIITEEELRELLIKKEHPIAYDGFEPSGLAHLPFAIYRVINLEDLIKAGVRFKLLIADWFAWINNKMEGDLEKIRKVGEYFVEVWKASGLDMSKVEILWSSDMVTNKDYWRYVLLIAKNTTLNRAIRALTIMGRSKKELQEVAQIFYPMMQVADIFWLEADICQLGLDQRRANMLAREIGPKLGLWKPVIVSHHMLMGLEGLKEPEGYDEDKAIDIAISSKMSKSKPESSIFIHDDEETIRRKIRRAYCPEKVVENNPIMDYCKHIIFRKFKSFLVERKEKYGGDIEFWSYNELKRYYSEGSLHPLDLKEATANYLNQLIKPIREHFEKDKRAKELYELVKSYEVTR
ncbi:MAG: tyrosine--tRNA ligase [Nitrososphaerales archaeon]